MGKFFDLSKYNDYPKPLRKNKYKFIFLMLLPSLFSFALFYVFINFQSILFAFRQFEGYDENGAEIFTYTMQNFIRVFRELRRPETSNGLYVALMNTLLLYVVGNAVTIPVALFTSYFLWKKIKGYKLFRVIFYMPSIVSSVVFVIIFRNIIAPNGLVSSVSIRFGGKIMPPLLAQDSTAIWMVMLYNTWIAFTGPYILLTAALNRIPQEIVESGQLDGVSALQEYFKICVPLSWPTIYILLIAKIAGILSADGPILLLTGGGYRTTTLGYWMYSQVFLGHSYEYPAAVGLMMTLVVAPVAIVSRNLLGRVYRDVDF